MGEKKCVRVILRWVDDEDTGLFEFDVVIDLETRFILGRWPIFGVYHGTLHELSPCILNAAGEIDFGVSESNDRFWTTDLRNVRIRRSEPVRVSESEYVASRYEIKQVLILGEKELV